MNIPSKRGRKPKAYITSYGTTIDGLYRSPAGRWRIVETGYQFTCHDESEAIRRFQQMTGKEKLVLVNREGKMHVLPASGRENIFPASAPPFDPAKFKGKKLPADIQTMPEETVWEWLRYLLLHHPEIVADKVNIPQLAHLSTFPLPRNPIPLQKLVDDYTTTRHITPKTKAKIERDFQSFCSVTGASTTRDITPEVLRHYMGVMEAKKHSSVYLNNIYSRIKAIFTFALKRGFEVGDIRPTIDRLQILRVQGRTTSIPNPTPISKVDFWKLYNVAKPRERAILLLALNSCMYLQEILNLKWDDIDFKSRTLCTRRNKTGIIRAAYIWDETIEALEKIKPANHVGVDILKSKFGVSYNASAYREYFDALKTKAGVSSSVVFSDIRDGAYTAAAGRCPEQLMKLLAGHSCGMADNYVARNPSMVKPATDAVYAEYFPALA